MLLKKRKMWQKASHFAFFFVTLPHILHKTAPRYTGEAFLQDNNKLLFKYLTDHFYKKQ